MKLKSIICLSLLFLISPISWGVNDVVGDIPSYFFYQLKEKTDIIKKKNRQGASFVFITDTHVKSNEMHSPQLIKYVLDNTDIHTVIWGGDAIMQYGGTVEVQWNVQLRFDSILNKSCNLYKVRGNHDFSILSKDGSIDMLFSNKESAKLLFANPPSGIHRNINDPGGCYYYFDDNNNKLRFIIFDTTDSVPSKNRSWGNIPYVHDSQLQWIVDSAVSTTRRGYDMVFVSHIPLPKDTTKKTELWKLKRLVDGINSYSSGMIGNVKYDFTKLKETKVLMCVAGHIHRDSEKYVDGVLYLTTANDGKWNVKKKGNDVPARKVGTVSEQCFDCFCISKDKKIVHTYRVGYGNDRHFHLEPLILSVNKEIKIKSMFDGSVSVKELNTSAKSKKKGKTSNGILSIDEEGGIKGIRKGNTTLVEIQPRKNCLTPFSH